MDQGPRRSAARPSGPRAGRSRQCGGLRGPAPRSLPRHRGQLSPQGGALTMPRFAYAGTRLRRRTSYARCLYALVGSPPLVSGTPHGDAPAWCTGKPGAAESSPSGPYSPARSTPRTSNARSVREAGESQLGKDRDQVVDAASTRPRSQEALRHGFEVHPATTSASSEEVVHTQVLMQSPDGVGEQRRNGMHLQRESGRRALSQAVGDEQAAQR